VKEIVQKQGFLIQTTSRAEFRKFVNEQFSHMGKIIKEANIKL